MREIATLDELKSLVGQEIAVSDWVQISQERVNQFAEATGDYQWIHLDVERCKRESPFGGPIARLGAIQQKLADMQTEIEAARALTWRAARLKEAGHPHTVEGAQAKLFASAVARRQTGEAIQILGGYGYMRDYPLERWHRDAKIFTIFEGTSEIQRLTIARAISGVRIR